MPRADPIKPGDTFGRLRVIRESPNKLYGRRAWTCYCDPELGGCGKTRRRAQHNLVAKAVKSCGCLAKEAAGENRPTPKKKPRPPRRIPVPPRGEAHHNAVLTAPLVAEARRLASLGIGNKEIAGRLRLGVDKSTLGRAVRGETWKSVPMP